MQDLGTEVPLRLATAEGSDIDVTAVLDEAGQAWLKSAMAGKQAIEIQLRPSEDDDVRAHAAEGGVIVTVTISGGEDDDVEGHAMSLHFPSMEAARDFERRLLATGLIAGTVAVSIVGVGITSQTHTGIGSAVAPLAGDAPTAQYAPTVRDTDRGDLTRSPFTISIGSGEHVGLSEAAAAGAAATTTPRTGDHVGLSEAAATGAAAAASSQYAPAVRDTDRVDAGTTVAGGRTVTGDHTGLSEAAGAGAVTTPQYAPAVRDNYRIDAGTAVAGGRTVSDSAAPGAAAATNPATGDHVGLTEAAAAAAATGQVTASPASVAAHEALAQRANDAALAQRSNDTVGGYMSAAGAAASSAVDPRAGDTVGGYMSAAGAAAAAGDQTAAPSTGYMNAAGAAAASGALTDPRAGDTVGGYMSAAAAAAASGAVTADHVGLSEMAGAGAAAADAPQYAPAVRDTDRGDLGTPSATNDDPQPRGPGPK